jgi:hypothetical protein
MSAFGLCLTIMPELNCAYALFSRILENEGHKLFSQDSFKLFFFYSRDISAKLISLLLKRQKQNLVCGFNYYGVGETCQGLRGNISVCLSTSWMDLLHSDFQTHATM